MSAFQEEAREQLLKELGRIQEEARRTDFFLIASDEATVNLYQGQDLEALGKAMEEKWEPSAGKHDFTGALERGRSTVSRKGLVILVSDEVNEEVDLPFDANLLAVGKPKGNVGFSGLRITEGEEGEAAALVCDGPKLFGRFGGARMAAGFRKSIREAVPDVGARRDSRDRRRFPAGSRTLCAEPSPKTISRRTTSCRWSARGPRSLAIRPVVVPILVEDGARNRRVDSLFTRSRA